MALRRSGEAVQVAWLMGILKPQTPAETLQIINNNLLGITGVSMQSNDYNLHANHEYYSKSRIPV